MDSLLLCITEKGESKLPEFEELNRFENQNIQPIVFLDSNICLDIIKVVDKNQNIPESSKIRIYELKKYLNKNKTEINALFGLLELCTKEDCFDDKKFWDFKHRIDFFIQINCNSHYFI